MAVEAIVKLLDRNGESSRTLTVDGLTPGATYAFQVRARGRLGFTDWSDSVTRMSM